MEDDLQWNMTSKIYINIVEFLSNHFSYFPQIRNLGSGDQSKINNAWNEDDLLWKITSNERLPPME